MNDATTDTSLMAAPTSQDDQPFPRRNLYATVILLLGIALLLPHIP